MDDHLHTGLEVKATPNFEKLKRLLGTALLWEKSYYVDGVDIADSLVSLSAELVGEGRAQDVIDAAIEAKAKLGIRHAPMIVMAAVAANSSRNPAVRAGVSGVIRRADELGEFLSLYGKIVGRTPDKLKGALRAQVKKGLADAVSHFDEYQMAKYNRRKDLVTLIDVVRLTHPRGTPAIDALVKDALKTPDTWETALSGGEDKKAAFERLLREEKLGYLALLRNVRNMEEANVDPDLMEAAILRRKGAGRMHPFNFLQAWKNASKETIRTGIDIAAQEAVNDMRPFSGKTAVLLDMSGSMAWGTDGSSLHLWEKGAALAALWPGDKEYWGFHNVAKRIPYKTGFAAIAEFATMGHGGTNLGAAVRQVCQESDADRLVVITDEQTHDRVMPPTMKRNYLINVGSNENGITADSGGWDASISGWSDHVIRYFREIEDD